MCDGQTANDCDIMSLTEYESTLNDQLVKLDHQFAEIGEELEAKKADFVEIYRKDPRISRDEEFTNLKQMIQDFNPMNAQNIPALETVETIETRPITGHKGILVCESFSGGNESFQTTMLLFQAANDLSKSVIIWVLFLVIVL